MTDSLLRSLRDRMLDESESLAGLLRKCLLLGAETGSVTLRGWARKELNGYDDEDDVPEYRCLSGVPISMDSISGNRWATGQTLSRFQLPQEAWGYVPDIMPFKQPVEALEQMAQQKSLSFSSPGLSMAQAIWNRQLGPFQSISSLSYTMTGSVVAGILGQIRTQLVDIIADLTADTPMSELPSKGQVDAAVSEHLGVSTVYNTTINAANGPVAIGASAQAKAEGLSVEDVLKLLDAVQEAAASDVDEADQTEVLEAVADLRLALSQESPETGEVVKKAGRLRSLGAKIGGASMMAATESAASTLTEMAMNGAFG
ncbi:hypothetical protein [Modestobacter sp. SSW1-42]|uniref:AbiTii domain-containing protein n=1 Tax=Modestobacter sp. SSW1-42 TaxID=596372 RepID=UPI003985B5C1